jgi:hypothetical protein
MAAEGVVEVGLTACKHHCVRGESREGARALVNSSVTESGRGRTLLS